MNQEVEPTGPEDLEEMERQDLEAFTKERNIDINIPLTEYAITPMEHFLYGSTPRAGGAVFPNLPVAQVAGASLEAINRVREVANRQDEESRIFYSSLEETPLLVVKLLPLTQENLSARTPAMTFEVTGAMNIGGNKVPSPENINQHLSDLMAEKQQKAADLLRARHQKRQI